jgi:DNA-binding PadR family transcriptional regulator
MPVKKAKAEEEVKDVVILKYLGKEGPKYFNELCRELEPKISRRTIYKNLISMERDGKIKSELVKSQFSEKSGIEVFRWVRQFKITGKGRKALAH